MKGAGKRAPQSVHSSKLLSNSQIVVSCHMEELEATVEMDVEFPLRKGRKFCTYQPHGTLHMIIH